MPNKTYKLLRVTNKELLELEQIIEDCQSHLQDYDLSEGPYNEETDEGCMYYQTDADCTKWSEILEKLRKKKYGKQRKYNSIYGGGGG
jgi:hypothetical protein